MYRCESQSTRYTLPFLPIPTHTNPIVCGKFSPVRDDTVSVCNGIVSHTNSDTVVIVSRLQLLYNSRLVHDIVSEHFQMVGNRQRREVSHCRPWAFRGYTHITMSYNILSRVYTLPSLSVIRWIVCVSHDTAFRVYRFIQFTRCKLLPLKMPCRVLKVYRVLILNALKWLELSQRCMGLSPP